MDESHLIYVKVWADGEQPIDRRTVLRLFDITSDHFNLQRATVSFGGSESSNRRGDIRSWLEEHLLKQHEAYQSGSRHQQVSTWHSTREAMSWCFAAHSMREHGDVTRWSTDPSVLIMVDMARAKRAESEFDFAKQVTEATLADAHIWFGLIDPATDRIVGRPSLYNSNAGNGFDWEHLVEQAYWRHDALGTRDRVRGIYWGNIYGAAFAKRIREAGYDEQMKALEEHPIPGVREGQSGATTIEGPHGGMAVLLDDSPRWFARTRERRMYSLERAVMTAAALKSTLSRAGLL
jgi:hypothetical protein